MANKTRVTKPVAKRSLPAALAKRAKAAHAAKRQSLAEAGFAAVAEIRDLRRSMAGDFLAMGRALLVLKGEGVADAMGYASFEALCQKELDLSLGRADTLIRLFERLDAALVRSLGVDRASALMNLADATSAADSVEDLLHAKLTLPSGETLDVERATVRAIDDAAAAFRRAVVKGGKRRGLTVSAAEQRRFDASGKRLKKLAGVEGVATKLIATRTDRGADVQARMPLAAWEALLRAAVRGAKASY